MADDKGTEHVVSRIGDQTWNLAALFKARNKTESELEVVWPNDLPQTLVDDAKAALYCALRSGVHGRPITASWLLTVARAGISTLQYLASLGVQNFGMVRALHLSDRIVQLRGAVNLGRNKRGLAPKTIASRMTVIEFVRHFSTEVLYPLPEHPWVGASLSDVCGCNEDDGGPSGKTGKTPVIPRSVQRALFECCEERIQGARALLQARDDGHIAAFSPELTAVRDAVLYLVQINSGMRNSESTGITGGCWRIEIKNGVTFHWVRTKEIKTTQGKEVDFLVPPELFNALDILQEYAKPFQERLADEALWLQEQLRQGVDEKGVLRNGMTIVEAVHRLNYVREIRPHLLLSLNMKRSDHLGTGSRVEVMSGDACLMQLKTLARAAGTDWELGNHQCRRTFSYNVANSKLGRMGLVFLKWQLKHATLSWTQLYASNPLQDHALYEEMHEEQAAARAEMMEGWMTSGEPLSGGAGRKIMEARAIPVRNLKEVMQHTAESIEISFTGHGLCLCAGSACHGQGALDPNMCAECSQAIITADQAPTWQMIHLDNLRLAAFDDCGPAIAQKAQRSIRRSEQVLRDLGVSLPTQEQAEAYAKGGAA